MSETTDCSYVLYRSDNAAKLKQCMVNVTRPLFLCCECRMIGQTLRSRVTGDMMILHRRCNVESLHDLVSNGTYIQTLDLRPSLNPAAQTCSLGLHTLITSQRLMS